MPRPELQVVGELLEALDRIEERSGRVLHRVLETRRTLQQVGPPHIAHEDEVAGEHAHRFAGCRGVGEQEAHVLRRVTRRVQRLDEHVAHTERVAVLQQGRAVGPAEVVPPSRTAFIGEKRPGSGAPGQLAGT